MSGAETAIIGRVSGTGCRNQEAQEQKLRQAQVIAGYGGGSHGVQNHVELYFQVYHAIRGLSRRRDAANLWVSWADADVLRGKGLRACTLGFYGVPYSWAVGGTHLGAHSRDRPRPVSGRSGLTGLGRRLRSGQEWGMACLEMWQPTMVVAGLDGRQ